jgi:4-carboxymuconolactone decarboxylase
MTEPQSRAQQLVGGVAPKLAELTDDVLFGDVWARSELSRRDRSLITVAALTALSRMDQLRSHLGLALDNGVAPEELAELATHLAFYAGWPAGMSAASLLQQVLDER